MGHIQSGRDGEEQRELPLPTTHSISLGLVTTVNRYANKGKGKGKVFPLQARLWPRGWVEVQLYSSMTAALEGSE